MITATSALLLFWRASPGLFQVHSHAHHTIHITHTLHTLARNAYTHTHTHTKTQRALINMRARCRPHIHEDRPKRGRRISTQSPLFFRPKFNSPCNTPPSHHQNTDVGARSAPHPTQPTLSLLRYQTELRCACACVSGSDRHGIIIRKNGAARCLTTHVFAAHRHGLEALPPPDNARTFSLAPRPVGQPPNTRSATKLLSSRAPCLCRRAGRASFWTRLVWCVCGLLC